MNHSSVDERQFMVSNPKPFAFYFEMITISRAFSGSLSDATLCLGEGLVVVFSDCFEFNHWDIFE